VNITLLNAWQARANRVTTVDSKHNAASTDPRFYKTYNVKTPDQFTRLTALDARIKSYGQTTMKPKCQPLPMQSDNIKDIVTKNRFYRGSQPANAA